MSHVERAPDTTGRPAARRDRPHWRRGTKVALIVPLVIAAGLSLVAGALVLAAERSLERVQVDGLRSPPTPDRGVADSRQPPAEDAAQGGDHGGEQGRRSHGFAAPGVRPLRRPMTLLLVGLDSRDGLSEEQLQALGTEDHGGELADGLMLVRLDPQADQMTLLSFPRDLLVRRCDGTRGKINGAYHIGQPDGRGASCVVQTVTDFTSIPVDHYVQVDLAGFIEVVDVLGGVHLQLDEPLKDRAAGLDLPTGCVELDGARALGFVRARKSLGAGGDLGRIARQQQLLSQVLRETTDVSTLADVPELFSLVATAGRAVETDDALSLDLVRRLVWTFRGVETEDVAMFTAPGYDAIRGGTSYLIPAEGATLVFERFADGTLDEETFAQHAGEPGSRTGTAPEPAAAPPAEPAPAAADHAASAPAEPAPADPSC
ncbi:MAG: hypothetical protein GEU81_15815 [Nitriliruptorales bacterium]|nr:hypothetical protein [Nitriliruptorales bacterium]